MIRTWQYNGAAPWNEVVLWCFNCLDNKSWFTNSTDTISFYTEKDYTLFMLRWS